MNPTGKKNFELTNHLGNVLALIGDRKQKSQQSTQHQAPEVVNLTDYYPFGMVMPGRSYAADVYRYGFQGQEEDDKLWGGAVSYKYRVEDPRLGRFFSVDPLAPSFPWNSPYAFSENRLIDGVELEGLEFTSVNENGDTKFYGAQNMDDYKTEILNEPPLPPPLRTGPMPDYIAQRPYKPTGGLSDYDEDFLPGLGNTFDRIVEFLAEYERLAGTEGESGSVHGIDQGSDLGKPGEDPLYSQPDGSGGSNSQSKKPEIGEWQPAESPIVLGNKMIQYTYTRSGYDSTGKYVEEIKSIYVAQNGDSVTFINYEEVERTITQQQAQKQTP